MNTASSADQRPAPKPSLKPIWFALGANCAIAVAKLAGALYTASGALLAEALHSLADTANQGLLLLGIHQAEKPPSPEYPLGHGRAVYFWSFIVALLLFSMGGLVSIYEGVHKLSGDDPVRSPWVAVAILVFGIFAEGFSLRTALQEINAVRRDMGLWEWFRTSRRSELLVIFGEDSAAIAGLALALVAVALTIWTGDPFYDACGSIAVGVLLVLVAFFVGREVMGLLIGQSAGPRTRLRILAAIEACPEVVAVESLTTLQEGEHIVVAARAQLRERDGVPALLADVQRVRAAVIASVPEVHWVMLEPVARAEHRHPSLVGMPPPPVD